MAKASTKSKLIFGSLNCLLIFAMRAGTARTVDDRWARAPFVLRETVAWHTGDSIPEEVRRFRTSPSDLPDPTNSEYLISQITNLSAILLISTSRCSHGKGEKLAPRLWRMKFLGASHVVTLTHATSGDVVRLHSAVHHQTVLYQVQELYRGRAT